MKPDPVLMGALAGITGSILKEVVDFLFIYLGISKYSYWEIAASIFVLPKDTQAIGGLILGFLCDFILGAICGIFVFYIIKFTGKDYIYLKGLGFGWLIWIVLFGFIVNLHVVRVTPTDIETSLSAFVEHSFLGIGIAWFIDKIYPKFWIDKF